MSVPEPELSGVDRLLADAAGAAHGARERLATLVVNLFLPDGRRLSDVQRVAMTALLTKLVGAVEDDLRRRLIATLGAAAPAPLAAGLAASRVAIAAPLLDRSGLLRDAELIAALLRRADEHRLVTALRLWSARAAEIEPGHDPALLDTLLQDGDPAVGAAAMALLVAESRRFDRFQDPVLARTDLPAELQHRLIWWVTAALRDYLVRRHKLAGADADRALVAAATGALAAYDEGETQEARAMQLAVRLRRHGPIDDRLVAQALEEGRLALAVAILALRAGIEFAFAWDMVTDPDGSRLLVLLRGVDMERRTAARIALRLGEAGGRRNDESIAERIAAFDALDAARARDAIRPWRLDGGYRRALAELANGLSHYEAAA